MGLLIEVYRAADGYDCTNHGISSQVKTLCVVNVDGPFDPSPDAPAVRLESGPLKSVNLVPVDLAESGKWTMFGGNYGGTSDSRFGDAIEKILGVNVGIVAIHDRVE